MAAFAKTLSDRLGERPKRSMPDRAAGGHGLEALSVARCLQGDLLGHCTDVLSRARTR